MQVSVETTEGLERKITIAVPSDQVDSAVNSRLQEAARNIRLDGFRKGKVPMKVVKNRYGKGVRQEVVGELMSQSYYQAISQESIKPAGQPRLEPTRMDEGEDLEFVALVEVYPEIELPDFKKIKVQQPVSIVEEADIDQMVETLRRQRQTWEPVDRAAADKDMVNIDYVGTLDGEEFEGGQAQGSNLVLGSERMIPGFEEGIIGHKSGDEFTLPLGFPEDYHNKDLAAKSVEFAITLNTVSEQKLPEIDEEFFKAYGVEEGGEEAFRAEVTNNMEREMNTAIRNKLKNRIMDALIALVEFAVPKSLVQTEIEQLKAQALQQMGGGQKLDASLLPDDLFISQAERRVVLGLVLGEVISQQNLKADAQKVRESVEELAATYESPEEVINWYYGNEEQLAVIENSVLEDEVFDHIIEQADISDEQLSYQEAIKPDQPATQSDSESSATVTGDEESSQ